MGNISLSLFLENLVAFQLDLDLSEFNASILSSMIFTADQHVCFGAGYDITPISFAITLSIQLWNMAMTILEDLLDFSSTWSGAEARYLDEIQASNNKDILFYDKTVLEAQEKILWAGTIDPKSLNCYGLPFAPSWT